MESNTEVDELVLDFLDLTPAPNTLASYWEKRAVKYRAAYDVAQRVVDGQANLIAKQARRIKILENALRMMEKERSRCRR